MAKMVKNLLAMQDIQVQTLDWEDSPGEGNGNLLQYSCLENPMDRGAWQATVHGVAQSQTRLKQLSMNTQELFSLCVFPSLPAKQGLCQIFIC